MDNFDLRKYLAEGKLLKEDDENSIRKNYEFITYEGNDLYDIDINWDKAENELGNPEDWDGVDYLAAMSNISREQATQYWENFEQEGLDEGKLSKEEVEVPAPKVDESMSSEDYDKIKSAVDIHKGEISLALDNLIGHRYWNIQVLPEWDNIIGGFNLNATATNVVGKDTVLDPFDIRFAIRGIKKLPFVSKAKISPRYHKKMLSVIAIGLKIK